MKVKIQIEFNVEPVTNEDEFEESDAKSAASMAAYDYLSLCEISGVRSDTENVTVHVDGFGQCIVSLGEDHE